MNKTDLLKAFSLIILLQIVLFISDARGEERYAGRDQNGTRYYLTDKKVLERTVQVSVKKVPNKRSHFYKNYVSFLRLSGAEGDSYSHSVVVYEIDCPQKKMRLITSKDFDRNGKVLLFKKTEDDTISWMAIPQGGVLESIREQVCKQ